MPLLDGQPHKLDPPPGCVLSSTAVWVIRFTGEIYNDYGLYCAKLAQYRKRVWTCSATQASELTFEEAIASEAAIEKHVPEVPECYRAPVLRHVHHATVRLEELCTQLLARFQGRWVPGEGALALRNGTPATCCVTAALNPPAGSGDAEGGDGVDASAGADRGADGSPGDSPSPNEGGAHPKANGGPAARPPRAPEEAAYRVHWLDRNGRGGGVSAVLRGGELTRRRAPLTKELLKRWLPEAAECVAVKGVKGMPCIWRVVSRLAERYDLPIDLPFELEERLAAAAAPRAPARAGGARGGRNTARAALKAEAAAIAAAAFAEGGEPTLAGLAPAAVEDLRRLQELRRQEAGEEEGTPGTGGRRAARGRLREGDALARLAAAESSRAARVERNNFKCSLCHRTRCPEGTPLVLCDGCPRSFHMACLPLAWGDLPETDWTCPKCVERQKLAVQRLVGQEERRRGAIERSASEELERGDKASRRAAEREAQRALERAERAAREQRRLGVEDLQALAEAQAQLPAAEARERELAAPGSRGGRPPANASPSPSPGSPKSGGRGRGGRGGAKDAAALRTQALETADRVARLRCLVEGPPAVQPAVREERARGALLDALAVVEFLAAFGAACEARPLRLGELQAAAAWPLDSPTLPELYQALLRCVLIEQAGQEGAIRARARRWTRMLGDATWPEVLRRYLLFTRQGGRGAAAEAAAAADGTPPGRLDDRAAALVAAHALAEQPHWQLGPELHLRLLAALCNDITEGAILKAEIAQRAEQALALTAERQKQLAEAKREGDEEGAEELEEALAGMEPGEEPCFQLPRELQDDRASSLAGDDQRWAWHARRAEAAERLAAAERCFRRRRQDGFAVTSEEAQAAAAEAREAAAEHEDALQALALRTPPLGADRHHRTYWWPLGEPAGVWVEEPDSSAVGLIASEAALDALMLRLNRRGRREKALAVALLRRRRELLASLGMRRLHPQIAAVPRPGGAHGRPPLEDVQAEANARLLRAGAERMAELAATVEARGEELLGETGSAAEWRARARTPRARPPSSRRA
ncbi:hypothetical protein WJX81_005263 [Elliptochloris bilobata]|uniref:PHD-type domain-containing protein n=1 Tax=Elliptochloris bilobata TaxID=381761 RepID=A0AAW1QLG7_9CHLO